jgi:hypothetical protein
MDAEDTTSQESLVSIPAVSVDYLTHRTDSLEKVCLTLLPYL